MQLIRASVKSALILLVLGVLHTLPLWNTDRNLVGGIEDTAAQVSIPEYYCDKILRWDFHDTRFFAPTGVSLANNYDSPFPMILTCAFRPLGGHSQFHIFAGLQILLLLLSAWLVARVLFPSSWIWQLAYCGFVWWSGFYVVRIHQHYTLLAGIWGFQLMLWMFLTVDWRRRARVIAYGALMGLVFSGTIHNVAMLSVPFLILLAFSLRGRGGGGDRIALVNAGLGALACLGVFLFFFGPSIGAYFAGELVRVPEDRAKYGLDLLGPLIPWAFHRAYDWLGIAPHGSLERYNSFDLLVVAAFVIFAVKGRMRDLPMLRPLLWIAVLSWIYSLGPVVRFAYHDLFANPLVALWSVLPPLSISRTPARFATMTYLSLTFLTFAAARDLRFPKWVGPALIAWLVVTGPVLNQRFVLPYADYRKFFPMKALEEIGARDDDTQVLNVPTFFSGDPTQNFLQLFHRKPISAGYLSYVSYTPKTLEPMSRDPLLNQMNCTGHRFGFSGHGIVSDPQALRAHLLAGRWRVILVNKLALGNPGCENLLAWVRVLSQYPWIRVMEESELYAVLGVQ